MILCGETGQPCAKPSYWCSDRCDLKARRERKEPMNPTEHDLSELRRVAEEAILAPMVAPEWVKPPFDGQFYADMYARHAADELRAVEAHYSGDWLLKAADWLRSMAIHQGPPQGSFHHVCMVLVRALDAYSEQFLSVRSRAERAEAERDEAVHWRKRREHQLELSGNMWMRDAEEALAGDTRALRNRVEMRKLGPVEMVASDADAEADLQSAQQRADTLEAAIERAAAKFEEYALLHYRKRTPDGDEKALTNQRMADDLRSALKAKE